MVVATAEKQSCTILILVGDEVTALDLDDQVHTPTDAAHASRTPWCNCYP